MDGTHILKFQKPPAINRAKPIDMLMVYPVPTDDSPFNLTPLSIMYPGAMFEARGMRVEYVDLRWDSQQMLEDLLKESAQVGVSCFTGFQCSKAMDVIERAKQINPKITVNVGGHHARMCTKDVEAEPLVDVVWPERSYGEDLFPFSEKTHRLWKRGDLQMVTSTGCPYACTFCALRSAWNPRDLDSLEHQVDMVYDLTGCTEVSFSDPNIGYNKFKDADGVTQRVDRIERMRGIGRILRKHGIRYDGNIRADYITPELVDAMAEAGCYSIEFGCESGNEWFLKNVIKKGHGVEAIKNANRCMAGSGISVMNSWVRGMPHETHEQWLDTMALIDWIMETAPEARASVYRFTPYPGGPAYDMAVKGDGIAKFTPPTTMRGWGELKLMVDATYWVAGLNFRLDNTTKNFPGDDWKLIEPYVLRARQLWKERRVDDFTLEDVAAVERLVEFQVRKHSGRSAVAA
jgi:radical SAM superfamily enzyme YgiQ (UPF0313 family)